MVRKINCPQCGKPVSVSSHWDNVTCPNCRFNFEIGVEVFELSPEEQKQETEAAVRKIEEEEKKRVERQKETKRRLREAFHLPEPDPHADIEFEDDEEDTKKRGKKTGKGAKDSAEKDEKSESEGVDSKKKMIIIGGAIGLILLLILGVGIILSSATRNAGGEEEPSEQVTESTNENAEQVEPADGPTVEQHDGDWTDGYDIDSNPYDGKHKIDLQSSDSGEQRDANIPNAVDEGGGEDEMTSTTSENNANPMTNQTPSDGSTFSEKIDNPQPGQEETPAPEDDSTQDEVSVPEDASTQDEAPAPEVTEEQE